MSGTQTSASYRDVIIEATAAQISDYDYNAFGIACRLDPANSGRGYFFLISGDGHYSIRWSNGRSLDSIVQRGAIWLDTRWQSGKPDFARYVLAIIWLCGSTVNSSPKPATAAPRKGWSAWLG